MSTTEFAEGLAGSSPRRRVAEGWVLLAAWLVANGATHVLVLLATGKIYYQLPPPWLLAAESSIDLLNLAVPLRC